MGISKVEYDNETLIDISDDTITPENLAEGLTAHNSNGDRITGTFPMGEVDTQAELIEQIALTLQGKASGGGSGGGENVSNTFTVTFDFDLASMQARNPSHTAMEIVEAYRNGYTVQGNFVYSVSADVLGNILCPLSMVIDMGVYGLVEFNTTILVSGVLAYISVDYNPDALTTVVKPISTLS